MRFEYNYLRVGDLFKLRYTDDSRQRTYILYTIHSTMSENNGRNTVPRDFLPRTGRVTLQHAIKHFEYRQTITPGADLRKTEENYKEFHKELNDYKKKCMKELTTLLKSELLKYTNDVLKWKIPNTDLSPVTYKDFKHCLADKEVWDKGPGRKSDIYILLYGRYQNGYDKWLTEMEEEFLKKENMVYAEKDPDAKERGSEGWLFKLIKSVRHETITYPCKDILVATHGADICAEKKNAGKNEGYKYTPLYTGRGYLKEKKEEDETGETMRPSPTGNGTEFEDAVRNVISVPMSNLECSIEGLAADIRALQKVIMDMTKTSQIQDELSVSSPSPPETPRTRRSTPTRSKKPTSPVTRKQAPRRSPLKRKQVRSVDSVG